MHILQVNTADVGGGAEAVAWQLFQAYRRLGHSSQLAVGLKQSRNPDVFTISHDEFRSAWSQRTLAVAELLTPLVGKVRGMARLRSLCAFGLGQPRRWFDIWRGREDFDFPGTWHLEDNVRPVPDIVHCHNLHGGWLSGGGYFDLSALAWLSGKFPFVLTLHDAWMLSGHCAHSFDCERWMTGCGLCPDLTIYPAIRRDATAYNWKQKREVYVKSRLYVATPSRWLMQKVEQSMLVPAIVEGRVIPNGVDLSVFHPSDRHAARAALDVPQAAKVLLFAANGVRQNVWKDYETMRATLEVVAKGLQGQKVLFIALGEEDGWEQAGQAMIRFVPYQKDPAIVARYFQAADVYLHAARADTFPNSVLEALACGVPVVATAVGGIPEQVNDTKTGFLVPPRAVEAMAERLVQVLSKEELKTQLGAEAVRDACARFDLRRQADAYLEWFQEIRRSRQTRNSGGIDRMGQESGAKCGVPA
jgi:glycosyltransferase involved in cell wall biosynthesis